MENRRPCNRQLSELFISPSHTASPDGWGFFAAVKQELWRTRSTSSRCMSALGWIRAAGCGLIPIINCGYREGLLVRDPVVTRSRRCPAEAIMNVEQKRLDESRSRHSYWKRWGPYVSERAWGTVREDYSATGEAWDYFPHDHARSRAYRWNEDGIGGVCDRHQYICLGLALWNDRDPILKERFFGLNGNEGNHGEDVKEYYFYL